MPAVQPPSFSVIRLCSIVLVWVFYSVLPSAVFRNVTLSLLFSHYALAFYYSKHQLKALTVTRAAWLPLLGLAGIGAAYFASGYYILSLVPFIGLHVALSETYMIGRAHPKADHWLLNGSRFLTSASLYLLLLHGHPLFSGIPQAFLHAAIAAGVLGFLLALRSLGERIPAQVRLDFIAFELSGVLVGYGLYWRGVALSYTFFVLYHVLTWILFPAVSFFRRDRSARAAQGRSLGDLGKFILLSGGTVALFLVLSAPSILGDRALDLAAAVPLWATIHFLSSFPLSRLNPHFISRYFYREKTA